MKGKVFIVKSGSSFYYVMTVGRSKVKSIKRYKSRCSAARACDKFLENLGTHRDDNWDGDYVYPKDI